MASTDIRQFIFYLKYLWNPTDFTNHQTWIQDQIKGLAEGLIGGSVLDGAQVTPGSGLQLNVASGILVSPTGRLVVISSGTPTVASPVGNPARTLIVVRPKLTDMTNIPEPINPVNTVPLHQKYDYDLLVLNGTPAVNPVYPAAAADDIVLAGLLIPAAASSISSSDFEQHPVSLPKKRRHRTRVVSSAYTCENEDAHIDADATSAPITILIPLAADVPGQEFTFVKTDASANAVAVSGADLISGQNSWDLEDQWSTISIRSVGTGWRVI